MTIDSKDKQRYELYLDEDTHWNLVALGARSKMHFEDYAELVLTEYIQTFLERESQNVED